MNVAKYIDHTLLKAVATTDEIKKLCSEAKEYGFYSVCVNSGNVELSKKELEGSDVKVCSVIGFPLGAMTKESKIFEAKDAVAKGAEEIDMVLNIGLLKSGENEKVYEEIKEIKEAIGDKVLKVIIETCYLTEDEKRTASELTVKAKADFIKTSTGFGNSGANFEDVKLMLDIAGDKAFVKAAGGVRDFETAKKYIEMGVMRLGTSSGIKILNGEKVGEGEY
ncbi:deoxyribose-phosphate aldolase [Haliovirga abyssi]|uniref:Deoxyribose-phosphate aldolase n=1 Tax=Haliovirga abyssi TaxID=2996794 RepID=A0AAU9DH67_9FUSO|nr:deoxyribose-phosphate aldolase [Haliovirga abyssi]BDU50842.1 deoxyribose-phosphate aldolase [Haliovirga abyssi]